MQFIRKGFDFFIHSNILVGIASASLTYISMNYYGSSEMIFAPILVFFSTTFGYHFIRLFEQFSLSEVSIEAFYKKQSKVFILVMILALIGTISYGFKVGLTQLLVLIPVAFITFFYAVPLIRYNGKTVSIRNYPRLKLVSIAIAWAVTTVLFPLQENILEVGVWLLFMQRILLIMVLVIPFDIRDMNSDIVELNTLPQRIGIAKTKRIGVVFLLLFIGLHLIIPQFDRNNFFLDLFVFSLSLFFLLRTKKDQSSYFFSFWVESIPFFWLLLVVLINR